MTPILHRISSPTRDKELYLSFIDWIKDKRVDINTDNWSFINDQTFYHYFIFHDEDDYIVFKLKYSEFVN